MRRSTIRSSDLPPHLRAQIEHGGRSAGAAPPWARPGGKYGIAAPERRTYRGVLYASRAEMLRAEELELMLRAGELRGWTRQVPFLLAPPLRYVVDFLVFHRDGRVWAEDVKGVETPAFRANVRLWREHGLCPLEIRKRGGPSRTIIPRTMEGKL
jgi:hypothetical protein